MHTVASLPAPSDAIRGAHTHVTDASDPAWGEIVSGGGGLTVPVTCSGAQWYVDDLIADDIPLEPEPDPPLETARQNGLDALQAAADAAHRRLSPSAEQDERHVHKAEDASGATLGDPEAAARLDLEARSRGISLEALIASIETKRAAFKATSAKIEAIRITGKTVIGQAGTVTGITEVLSQVQGALQGIGS